MEQEIKEFIIKVLQDALINKGDDLQRAKLSFQGFTYTQMNEQFGQTGKTCCQVLDDYQKSYDKCKRAVEEIKKL